MYQRELRASAQQHVARDATLPQTEAACMIVWYELEQGRTILFPIRLDDTVLHTSSGWAAQLHTWHIGDFQGWKDHDRYQEAFTRLLQDPKAKEQGGM